jgi:hypothetical protein
VGWRDTGKVALSHASTFHCHIDTHADADLGCGKRRGIVDAVTGHPKAKPRPRRCKFVGQCLRRGPVGAGRSAQEIAN